MISATLKPQVCSIETLRLPERKPVTIALGFTSLPGVVLCSDTQMTSDSGFKFEESKFLFPWEGGPGAAVGVYAGIPALAKSVERNLNEYLSSQTKQPSATQFERGLQGILNRACNKQRGQLQMLWAYPTKECVHLYRVERRTITDVIDSECLGIGDSSLVRFLLENLPILRTRDAARTAFYIVSQAMKYVDGVGGTIEMCAIYRSGRVRRIENPLTFETIYRGISRRKLEKLTQKSRSDV